uniref:Uncharacterized protein n=2 Tax=Babesia bovis TaxID=5865 RepID=A7AWV6_BABBO|eukprot:XP_001609102.1 hypothetical protein [Babesia bovis T2Bo]
MRFFNETDKFGLQTDDANASSDQFLYTLSTCHPYAVQRIIYYIYKNDYQNLNEDAGLLVPIYQEAGRFELTELKHSVLRLIRSQHNIEVLVNLSYAAECGGDVELAQECGRLLADAAFAVFSCDLLKKMGISAVRTLLACDNIQLDEVQTFTVLCQFLDQNNKFVTPYSSLPLGPIEKDFLKHIRFCSLSPKSIDRIRHDNISPLLLDAVLRILQGTQKRPRHFPWLENDCYSCLTYNGLFPVVTVRASKEQLGFFDPNTGNAKLVSPPISQLPVDSGNRESFTTGTEREISIGWWAYEVSRTEKGRISVGLAFRSQEPIDEASRLSFLSMPNSRRIVFYYDFGDDRFKSGYIDVTNHHQLNSVWSYDLRLNSNAHKLRHKDVITVNVIVATSCITLNIGVLDSGMKRTFQIPHRATGILGNIIKRPCIFGAPFFILEDIGDSLSIPELRFDVNL